MGVAINAENVAIRYITGDFKDIGIKEYVIRRIKGNYHVNEFMAVDGVSFELEEGEMLGIIGSNGAGKSTLLKAISGIMVPTRGRVEVKGEVAALLELGSGFDGDLTVKENAYLRGAMLGYTQEFMDKTYDAIIDFAELREFEDRPFKQLSSGMKSRLAFSIASLVNPDILILDEVLSVGDGAFQEKSARKMREIISGGATTILVSHSLDQIRELCTKVLWLDHGRQIAFGETQEICDRYERFLNGEKIVMEEQKTERTERKLEPREVKKPIIAKKERTAAPQSRLRKMGRPKGNVSVLAMLISLLAFLACLAATAFLGLTSRFDWLGWLLAGMFLIACAFFQRNRLGMEWKSLCVISAVCLCVALLCMSQLYTPLIMDTVTVTALGEKGERSSADEIMLKGFWVDGDYYPIQKPTSGKWFWGGDRYMWRDESDSRQPDGTTRSVSFSIPVGEQRELAYSGDVWNGYMLVECMDQSEIIDTYNDYYYETTTVLPPSSARAVSTQENVYILLFCLLYFLLTTVLLCLKKKLDWQSAAAWIRAKDFYLISSGLSVLMLVIMMCHSSLDSFWNDEIYQIFYCVRGENPLKTALITHAEYYPVITDVILFAWYRIAPYGERWLLLPLEISTAFGVYVLSLAVNKVHGKRVAVLAALLGTMFSTSLVFQGGYEFRDYGFLFLACAAAIYVYVSCRLSENVTIGRLVLFGVALWLPPAIHVYGALFSASLVLIDWLQMYKKKLSTRWFVSYLIAVALYLPWIYNLICFEAWTVSVTWQTQPSLNAVGALLINFFSSGSMFFCFMLVLGMCLSAIRVIDALRSKANLPFFELILIVPICFTCSLMYIYGKWIHPSASLWMSRYFLTVFPCAIWCAAAGLDLCLSALKGKREVLTVCVALLVVGMVLTEQRLSQPSPTGYQHYREAADWLYWQQNTIYNDDTIVIFTPDAPYLGWMEYYVTKQGIRDPFNIINASSVTPDSLSGMSVIYLYYEHVGIPYGFEDLLTSNGFYLASDDGNLKIRTYYKS